MDMDEYRNILTNEYAKLIEDNEKLNKENQQNIYAVGTGKSDLKYAQDKANANSGWAGALAGALQGAASGFATTGSPWGALGGGAMGAYSGYQRNPYV